MTHRRSFLKKLAAGAAVLAIPFTAKAKAKPAAFPCLAGLDPWHYRVHPARFDARDRLVDDRDWPAILAADEIDIEQCDVVVVKDLDLSKKNVRLGKCKFFIHAKIDVPNSGELLAMNDVHCYNGGTIVLHHNVTVGDACV